MTFPKLDRAALEEAIDAEVAKEEERRSAENTLLLERLTAIALGGTMVILFLGVSLIAVLKLGKLLRVW
jgi:hypothetical protein